MYKIQTKHPQVDVCVRYKARKKAVLSPNLFGFSWNTLRDVHFISIGVGGDDTPRTRFIKKRFYSILELNSGEIIILDVSMLQIYLSVF